MDDPELLNTKFEHALEVHELLEEFLEFYGTLDRLNQPTLLDFAEWLGDECRNMANQLGLELDGEQPQAE